MVAEGEAAVEAREEGTLVSQTQEGQLGLGTVREFGRGGEEPGMSQSMLLNIYRGERQVSEWVGLTKLTLICPLPPSA